MNILFFVFVSLISIVASQNSDHKLIFSQVLFRHGARAPSVNLTNPSYAKQFHRGKGELTDRGFDNSYKLGKFLKKRYVDTGFLNPNMIPSEMYWRSVNKRRCLSTAATVGASMFEDPAKHLQVAVFTDELGENLLSYAQADCPREMEIVKEKCPAFNGMFNPWPVYEGFIAECLKYDHPVFKDHPFPTIEAHMNEYKNGIDLPPALAGNLNTVMEMYVNVTQFITGTGNFHNKEIMKMKFGYLVHMLLRNLEKAGGISAGNSEDEEESRAKFVAYSTQDWILMGVLDSFGALKEAVGLDTYPEYNSMIIIELLETKNKEMVVKMYYKKEEDTSEDHQLIDITANVRNCAGSTDGCPLKKFVDCCSDYKHSKPLELCQMTSKTKKLRRRHLSFENIENVPIKQTQFTGPE